MKKEIFLKLTFIFIIFLNNNLFSQNSEMEELYKKCWLFFNVKVELNDNNKDAVILINIKDSTGYNKEYNIKNNEARIISIPFGKIYDFTIGSPRLCTKVDYYQFKG